MFSAEEEDAGNDPVGVSEETDREIAQKEHHQQRDRQVQDPDAAFPANHEVASSGSAISISPGIERSSAK